MPGLAGIVRHPWSDSDRSAVEQMLARLTGEASDPCGLCLVPAAGAGVAWTSRAGSYDANLPVWNETGEIGLLFAGEHFADATEARDLRSAGHELRDDGAGCLVHLYEDHGDRFLERLNGTFAGALIDKRANKVVLFNDRYGLGRLYCHEADDGFFFASEAKSLLQVVPRLRQLDPRGLAERLVCGCALQGRTLFPGISLLPPGAAWTFRPGQPVRKATYFSPAAWEAQTPLPPEEYFAALKDVFGRILPRYFRGPRRVGLSVTGGLDSRMIIAGLRMPPGQLPCYTFGGMYRECEDVRIGRQVAQRCGQPHQVITVDDRFFPRFLDLAQRCVEVTDGTMDVSGAVGLQANRQAREIAPVRMTGNYGSEILRRYVAFEPDGRPESFLSPGLNRYLRLAAETYAAERQACPPLSFIAFKQVPWHHYARLAEEQSQLAIRAPYLDNELVALAYRAPKGNLLNKQLAYRYTVETDPRLAGVPTDRGFLDPPPLVPRKAFALAKEIRPRIEYYLDYGMPHWLARADRLLAALDLERRLLGQQKYYHFRHWYRYPLSGVVQEVLLDPRTLARPYLDRRRVERIVTAHTRGTGNYTLAIHQLLTGELIERRLIEQS